MTPQFNNLITIPCGSEKDFFRFWLIFLTPIHSLSPKPLDIAVSILYTRYVLSKTVLDKDLLDDIVLGKSVREQLAKEYDITRAQLNVLISRLRTSGFLIGDRINPKYIPNYKDEDKFKMLIRFDIRNNETVGKESHTNG